MFECTGDSNVLLRTLMMPTESARDLDEQAVGPLHGACARGRRTCDGRIPKQIFFDQRRRHRIEVPGAVECVAGGLAPTFLSQRNEAAFA